MNDRTRRDFLADVGRGMLIATLGPGIVNELSLASAHADEGPDRLSFGQLEPLVAIMQETPLDRLLPDLVEKLAAGTQIRTLIAAGALANARTFGGQDYTGYHAFMALAPAFEMAKELPEERKSLPALKVLYRNSKRIQEKGGRTNEVLHPIPAEGDAKSGEALRDATRKADMNAAEHTFAAVAKEPKEAFDQLQAAIQDDIDVHRVVLAWRAWTTLDLTGMEQAHTLLRQSVRFCVESEQQRIKYNRSEPGIRTVLPKLLEQHKLLNRTPGVRDADDAWIAQMSETICNRTREQAAEAVATALAEGFSVEAIGEAISLAANMLVLRDPGRQKADEGKPVGSIHGASVGVHASDSANAWRNISRVGNVRNKFASLIVGAYHTAGQINGLNKQSYPLPEHLDGISNRDAAELLRPATQVAVEEKDQAKACALVHHYGSLNHSARPMFDLLLRYAVSEDGALHAEKYYRTVTEEFAATRPAFRWRHLAALARVTASEYGFPAPGYQEACRLLKV